VTLAGKGVARTPPVVAARPGTVSLSLQAAGKAKKQLRKTRSATVEVTVTYTPAGGTPNAQTRRLKLRRTV
jgi:hypothetical protein